MLHWQRRGVSYPNARRSASGLARCYLRLIFLLLLPAMVSWGADLRAGAAQVVITPPRGAPMAGYYTNRAATGVHDDLHANALVFEKDGVRAAVVACDLANLPRPYVDEARHIIREKTGIAPDHVMISATHTHTGPVILTQPSRYVLEGEMKRIAVEYAASLPGKIADSVVAAVAVLQPAQVRSGIGREDSVAFNRRYFMKGGSVAWNPRKLDPNILRPAGPTDPAIHVIYVETLDERPIGAYMNYAMHQDTTGGLEFSADFSYALGKAVREAKGSPLTPLFTIGCAGNVNHLDVSRKQRQSGFEEATRIGIVLAGGVLKTIQAAPIVDIPSIRVSTEMLKLPTAEVTPDEAEWARVTSATFGKPDAAPFLDLVRAAKDIELISLRGRPMDAEVQVITLGDNVAFVGLPAEIFVELGLTLKQDSPYPNTIIAELANGALGYIPNRQAYPEGGYEVVASRVEPGAGEMLMTSALRQLIELFHRH